MTKLGIKQVFENLHKRAYNKAQLEMTKSLPYVINEIHMFVRDTMEDLGLSDMTGNYINSFGIAIYRDGEFIACATTNDIEGNDPIQVTLANGDTFEKGRVRYDGTGQEKTFKAGEDSTHRIYANQEVVRWLRANPPTEKKTPSLSYRIVTVVDYAKMVGGNVVLMKIADDIEGRGGNIREFRFA